MRSLRKMEVCGNAYSVVGLNEGVVDGDDLDIVVLDAGGAISRELELQLPQEMNLRIAEDDTTNAAETVDTDLL